MDDTELYTTLLGIRLPWRVTRVRVNMAAERVDVWVEEAPGTTFPCALCREPVAMYDHTPEQAWRHLDTCQCATYVHARLPRTACPVDDVKQVPAPWAEPRSEYTRLFERQIIDTSQECDVAGVRRLLRTTWDATWGVLERAVARGLGRKPRRVPARLGVDEKAIRKGHHYETLVVDLDTGTVEAVLDGRTQASLEAYYRQFTPEELATIEAIARDMWEPYIRATHACVPDATTQLVFNRYHATRYVTEAMDQVRRQEHQALQAQDDRRLTGTKHLWLWNEENIPAWRRAEFDALKHAEKYFTAWYFWATHSRLTPIIEAARTLKRHLPNLLTYFKRWITNAMSEGINSKVQTLKVMACGYRNRAHYKTAMLFHCGGLDLYPRPEAG